MAEKIALRVLAEFMIKHDYKNTSEITQEHQDEIKKETINRVKKWLEN